MATRNLTRKFVDLRNSAKANRRLNTSVLQDVEQGDNVDLLRANEENWQGPKTALPPVWVEKIEQMEEQIQFIQAKSKKQLKLFPL